MEGKKTRWRRTLALASMMLCSALCAVHDHYTRAMTLDEAAAIVASSADPKRVSYAAAAIRRAGAQSIALLRDLAQRDDAAGVEARAALQHLREALR